MKLTKAEKISDDSNKIKKFFSKESSTKEKTNKSKSLHLKLLGSMFFISIIPIIIICSVTFIKINDITSSNFKASSTASTLGTKKLLDSQFENIINLLKSFSKKDIFTNSDISSKSSIDDVDEIKKDLKLIKESNSSILSTGFAFDKSKSYYYYPEKSVSSDFNPTAGDAYKGAAQFRDVAYITNVYKNSSSNSDCVTISYGVRKNNESIGVISIDLDLNSLSKNLTNMLGESSELEFILCDSNGQIIASTDDSIIDTKEVTNYSVWNNINSNTSGFERFSFENQNYLVSYETSEVTGWKFISKIPENVMTKSKNSLISNYLIIIILVIISIIAISTRFSRNLSKNILKIRNAISEASLGNFNNKIEINSKDELENLANSFNSMCVNVSSLLSNVNSSVKDVNFSATTLNNKSKELSLAISNVNETIGKIDLGTTDSTNNLESLVLNMDEVSNSINRIDSSAHNVNAMASKANLLSKSGLDIIQSSIDKTTTTKKITKEVNDVIELVSKSVEEISIMNETITKITGQTNLLALNASIEAARAGDAGKGFSVVADEIKKLADQTALSAKEISKIIAEIKLNVDNAVQKADETNNAVESQENSIKQFNTIFNNIISSIGSLNIKVNDISKDLGALSNKKDQVLNQVQSLSTIIEDTSEGAGNVACVCQDVDETTNEFLSSSSKLKHLANNLQSEVNKFTYK